MSQPERIGLSKQALANLTEPLNPIRPLPPTAPQNISFAQGIGVELPSKKVKKVCVLWHHTVLCMPSLSHTNSHNESFLSVPIARFVILTANALH